MPVSFLFPISQRSIWMWRHSTGTPCWSLFPIDMKCCWVRGPLCWAPACSSWRRWWPPAPVLRTWSCNQRSKTLGAAEVLTFQPYSAPGIGLYVQNKGSSRFGPGGLACGLGPGDPLNPLHWVQGTEMTGKGCCASHCICSVPMSSSSVVPWVIE